MGIRVYGVGVSFIVTVLLARGLGSEGYGIYSYWFAIVNVAVITAQFGVPLLVVRETSKAVSSNEINILSSLWRWAHKFIAVSSVVSVLIAWIFVTTTTESDSSYDKSLFVFCMPLVILISISSLRASILRGIGFDVIGQIPEYAALPTIFGISIFTFLTIPSLSISVETVFLLQIFSASISTAIGVFILYRFGSFKSKFRPTNYQKKAWFRSAFYMGSIFGLTMAGNSVLIIVLGMLTNEYEVGSYRLAATVGGLISLGLQTMNMYGMPHITRHLERGESEKLNKIVVQITQFSFGLAALSTAFFLLFGQYFLNTIFGDEFSNTYDVLMVLALGHMVNAFLGPSHAMIVMAGREKLAALLAAASTVISLGSSFYFIPSYGAVGAAVAASLSIVTVKTISFIIVWRSFSTLCWPFPKLKVRVE